MTHQYLIKRRIEIDAAHRIPDHGSKCFNLHGHRYVIEAAVKGPVIPEGTQTGMVIDFGFIKELMIQEIHDPCDHGLILFKDDSMVSTFRVQVLHPSTPHLVEGIKLLVLDSVPTAENLAAYWYEKLGFAMRQFWVDRDDIVFSQRPKLHSITVWETPNCQAIYPAPE